MARQNNALEFNTFVKGLMTEASPLTFPENASLDEKNFVLLRDGSRRRRLGMDYEEGYEELNSNAEPYISGELPVTTYRWSDASGDPDQQIAVVQIGSFLKFFNLNSVPLSSGLIYTYAFQENTTPIEVGQVSMTSVDGVLVVVGGQKEVYTFEYNDGTITPSTETIKVRDLFGVEDIDPDTGNDLRDGNDIAFRPVTLTDNHLYNLRNQTWSIPRRRVIRQGESGGEIAVDLVRGWAGAWSDEGGIDAPDFVWPSNADSVNSALFPDSEDPDDRVGDRFWPSVLRFNPGTVESAPRGHFIIDVLERGTSRMEALAKLNDRYTYESGLSYFDQYQVSSLPIDKTVGGPKCLDSFSGRVWYAGFSSELIDGGKYSPRLSSYVMFSKLVESVSDIGRCYQEADPTSSEDSDLVDTDGGFIRVAGAEDIQALVNIGDALLVLASNGVWAITGGSDYGFSATNYKVDKLTKSGISGPQSAVVVDNGCLYWSNDGIYSIQRNEFGALTAQNISKTSIQTFYQDIEDLERRYSRGFYDRFDRKVRWLYNNRPNSTGNVKELVLDVDLGAFYPNELGSTEGLPLAVAILETPPYRVGEVSEAVTVNGTNVTVDGETVEIVSRIRQSTTREIVYVTITQLSPSVKYTFSLYRDTNFLDWESFDSVGVDSPAYLVTGYLPGGDFQRYKQAPYLTMHFLRTEDGFEEDASGDLTPTNQSSCLVQARWDWANSANSNRWGREFQAYKYKRFYMPADANDPYDTGHETIVSKNKLRGKGRVLSLLMKTEPGKDCRIQGWSMIIGVNGNV